MTSVQSRQHSNNPQHVLLDLLLEIDAAPNLAAVMRLFLRTLAELVPCDQSVLYEWNGVTGRANASTGHDPSFANAYLSHGRVLDPCSNEQSQQRCLLSETCCALSDLMDTSSLKQTAFYNQFLNHHAQLSFGLAHTTRLSADSRLYLRLFRSAAGNDFSQHERAVVDLFQTHITAKMQQLRSQARLKQMSDALQAGLDLYRRPIFLLDDTARVVACNAAARTAAQQGKNLKMADDRLLPGDQADHSSWINLSLEKLLRTDARGSRVATHLQALRHSRGGPVRHFGLLARLKPTETTGQVLTSLTLIDLQRHPASHPPEQLRRAFGFTIAEARVADALTAGLDTEQIAEAFQVRRDTVRSHIKRLLAKTGTRGNAELQKLLIRIAPPLVALQREQEFEADLLAATAN